MSPPSRYCTYRVLPVHSSAGGTELTTPGCLELSSPVCPVQASLAPAFEAPVLPELSAPAAPAAPTVHHPAFLIAALGSSTQQLTPRQRLQCIQHSHQAQSRRHSDSNPTYHEPHCRLSHRSSPWTALSPHTPCPLCRSERCPDVRVPMCAWHDEAALQTDCTAENILTVP